MVWFDTGRLRNWSLNGRVSKLLVSKLECCYVKKAGRVQDRSPWSKLAGFLYLVGEDVVVTRNGYQ